MGVLGPGSALVLDVGARWGAGQAWYRLDPLARLVGFEPDAAECARLNAAVDPERERYVPVALWHEAASLTLHVTAEPACSSVFPPSAEALARMPWLRRYMDVRHTTAVRADSLAAWAARDGVRGFDFAKLDVQGAELAILRGAGPLLDTCLGLEVEVEFLELYAGQPLFPEVDAFLRQKGFALWRLSGQAHYGPTDDPAVTFAETVAYNDRVCGVAGGGGRLAWANALYFRDWTTVGDPRDRLVLAALLEAAGDPAGAAAAGGGG